MKPKKTYLQQLREEESKILHTNRAKTRPKRGYLGSALNAQTVKITHRESIYLTVKVEFYRLAANRSALDAPLRISARHPCCTFNSMPVLDGYLVWRMNGRETVYFFATVNATAGGREIEIRSAASRGR